MGQGQCLEALQVIQETGLMIHHLGHPSGFDLSGSYQSWEEATSDAIMFEFVKKMGMRYLVKGLGEIEEYEICLYSRVMKATLLRIKNTNVIIVHKEF